MPIASTARRGGGAQGRGGRGAASSSTGRRHIVEKYSSRIGNVQDASNQHLLDWIENAEAVWANRQYLANQPPHVIFAYLFVMFGLLPSSPLPSHDKNQLLATLQNEYVRRGKPIETNKWSANEVLAQAEAAFRASAGLVSDGSAVYYYMSLCNKCRNCLRAVTRYSAWGGGRRPALPCYVFLGLQSYL